MNCPDCDSTMDRREFLKTAGAAVVTAAAGVIGAESALAQPNSALTPALINQGAAIKPASGAPESLVKLLYNSLTPGQKEKVALPWDDKKRKIVNANWAIVDPTIGATFNKDQQELIHGILKGVTSEEWYPKFLAQYKNDGGGIENYHVALFGDPNSGKSEWVLTGRHATIRCGGDPAENMAFGGPIFYGHAPKDTEDPAHPGNLYWYQAKRANEVFQMLDSRQRKEALIAEAPDESAVSWRKAGDQLPGIPLGSLSRDQKEHVQKVMHDVLAPYRPSDVQEVIKDVKASGGLEKIHLAFYKQDDLGNDGVWDIWRLEGPSFVWHFRGSPHVHTWVNVGRRS